MVGEDRVEVIQQNLRFTVPIDPRLRDRRSALVPGNPVFLAGGDSAAVVEIADGTDATGGLLAEFDRWENETRRRMFVRYRDEEILTESILPSDATLNKGDIVRLNRDAAIVFEKIGPAPNKTIIDHPPAITSDKLGGLTREYEKLKMAIFGNLIDRDKSHQYGLPATANILLTGKPGLGKTLIARIACYELESKFNAPTRFMHCKPGEWESMWHGQSAANCREWFASVRREAEKAHVVAFFDEIEAIGRHRGGKLGEVADKLTCAFLAELDGFEGIPNVCIIAATNSKTALDPALVERLSGVEIVIPRPSRAAAFEIFGIHLPAGL
ncbi:MAG: ATP-binding protein, partial [Verrucomicrobiales bacterium]